MTDGPMKDNPYLKQGWDGPELPLELQALILYRKFGNAVQTVAANVALLHQEVAQSLEGVEGAELMDQLSKNPFFVRCLTKLSDSHEEFGDSAFRKNAGQLFDEVRDELEDMVTWMVFALWVHEGAEFPEGLLEMYGIDTEDPGEEE